MFSESMSSNGCSRDVCVRGITRRARVMRQLSSVGLGLALLPSCSPSLFALRERRAGQALTSAEADRASERAPYELTLSRLYLAKARELASEAHYALALTLAERSTESALRARALSLARVGSSLRSPARGRASAHEREVGAE